MTDRKRRTNHGRWKGVYGLDRGYSRRFDAAKERAAIHVCGPTCKRNRKP